MSLKIISNYVAGYTLAAKYTDVTLTATGTVGATGLVTNAPGTVFNNGLITTASTKVDGQFTHDGVDLEAGGVVFNKEGGVIIGSIGAFVHGPGNVYNYGAIEGFKGATYGVELYDGGTLINGRRVTGDPSALMIGGVRCEGARGHIYNYDVIKGSLSLYDGGTVKNGGAKATAAYIQGAVAVDNDAGATSTVTNYGLILSASQPGVAISLGGAGQQITNGTSVDNGARIQGEVGVFLGTSGTVSNFGTIIGAAGAAQYGSGLVYAGAQLDNGGSVTNGSVADITALIEGYEGIVAYGASATIANYGSIFGQGGTGSPAIKLTEGGQVTNGAGSDTAATIRGFTAVDMEAAGTVLNRGEINGLSGYGVVLRAGGTVTNGGGADRAALIEGYIGVDLKAGGTIDNAGTIGSTAIFPMEGVYMSGGTLANGFRTDPSATIQGYVGVKMIGATVTNYGVIDGLGGASGYGIVVGAGGAVINAGLIEGSTGLVANGPATVTNLGTIASAVGPAVVFKSASDTLVVWAGSTFTGDVLGGGGTLTLANGTGSMSGLFSAGMTVSGSMAPTSFQDFNTVQINSGATFSDADATTTMIASDTLIDMGAVTLSGAVANAGAISLNGGKLVVGAAGLSLSGAGSIRLSNSAANAIVGASSAATLALGQKLTGAGKLGGGQMTLAITASGVISANAAKGLIIDTGANTITNAGTILSAGAGGVTIKSAIANTGRLVASSGTLTLDGVVSGTGYSQINAGVLKAAATSTFNERVVFASGSTGTLELANSRTYSGTVSGFSTASKTFLDLDDITFTAGTTIASYAGGVLTVSDGTHTTHIHMVGAFSGSTWVLASDGHGGTLIHDPLKAPTTAPPTRAFVQAMASVSASHGVGVTASDGWRPRLAMLAPPRVHAA